MRFVGKRLSDDEKYELLNNVFVPDDSYLFPFSIFGGQSNHSKRAFKSSWLKTYPGLVYSPSEDGAFCLPCLLFSTDTDARGQLVKEPFKNWKKATERFNEHFHNKRHNSGDTSTTRKTGIYILQHITKEIKDCGGWFSLSADEVLDIANQEQLAVILRYVDRKGNTH